MLHLFELGEEGGCPDENKFIILDGGFTRIGAQAKLNALLAEYREAEPEPDNRSIKDFTLWLKNADKMPAYDYTFVLIDSSTPNFKADLFGPKSAP